MSRVLVVGPVEPARTALFRAPTVLHHRSDVDAAPEGYDAVIVINDGSADAVRRLDAVLELGTRQPAVQLAVMSFVQRAPQAALVHALSPGNPLLSFGQACALLRAEQLPVRARVTPEAITFEYQV